MIGINASPFLWFALFLFFGTVSFYVCEEEGTLFFFFWLLFNKNKTSGLLFVCLVFVIKK
jgi:uncharacterized RDD family membrane protein YckC